jgi:hypothetical protein
VVKKLEKSKVSFEDNPECPVEKQEELSAQELKTVTRLLDPKMFVMKSSQSGTYVYLAIAPDNDDITPQSIASLLSEFLIPGLKGFKICLQGVVSFWNADDAKDAGFIIVAGDYIKVFNSIDAALKLMNNHIQSTSKSETKEAPKKQSKECKTDTKESKQTKTKDVPEKKSKSESKSETKETPKKESKTETKDSKKSKDVKDVKEEKKETSKKIKSEPEDGTSLFAKPIPDSDDDEEPKKMKHAKKTKVEVPQKKKKTDSDLSSPSPSPVPKKRVRPTLQDNEQLEKKSSAKSEGTEKNGRDTKDISNNSNAIPQKRKRETSEPPMQTSETETKKPKPQEVSNNNNNNNVKYTIPKKAHTETKSNTEHTHKTEEKPVETKESEKMVQNEFVVETEIEDGEIPLQVEPKPQDSFKQIVEIYTRNGDLIECEPSFLWNMSFCPPLLLPSNYMELQSYNPKSVCDILNILWLRKGIDDAVNNDDEALEFIHLKDKPQSLAHQRRTTNLYSNL